jgi:hypothetical protein
MHANEETTRCEDDTLEPFYRVDNDGRLSWTEEGLRTSTASASPSSASASRLSRPWRTTGRR